MQDMSDAEKNIMKIVWDQDGTITFSELMEILKAQSKEWKSTTVRTFLNRLIDKGYLRSAREGQMVRYHVTVSEEQYLSVQAKTFVQTMFDGNVKNLLASLFGQDSLDEETMEDLEEFWEQGKEELDE